MNLGLLRVRFLLRSSIFLRDSDIAQNLMVFGVKTKVNSAFEANKSIFIEYLLIFIDHFIEFLITSPLLCVCVVVDYILIFAGKVETQINENEVDSIKYVTKSELFDHMFVERKEMITPWFWKIGNRFLGEWWDALNSVKDGESFSEVEEAIKPYLDTESINEVEH